MIIILIIHRNTYAQLEILHLLRGAVLDRNPAAVVQPHSCKNNKKLCLAHPIGIVVNNPALLCEGAPRYINDFFTKQML